MAESNDKPTREEMMEILKDAQGTAELLRDGIRTALRRAGADLDPLTLMIATAQEYAEATLDDPHITEEAFITSFTEVAHTVAKIQAPLRTLMRAALDTQNADPTSAASVMSGTPVVVPQGAFLVPGPERPQ